MSKDIREQVSECVRRALCQALGRRDDLTLDPHVTTSQFADFQVNSMLSEARKAGQPPRELAKQVADILEVGGTSLIAAANVSGPGYLNLTISNQAILRRVQDRLLDERLGVPVCSKHKTVVIDYSQPNIAKEMHVGHLRSTIIGDSLARTFDFLGYSVLRQNHIGDWGTQFGMLIQYLLESGRGDTGQPQELQQLNSLYRESRTHFDENAAFAERARRRVVLLQGGDQQTIGLWKKIVSTSQSYFQEVYRLLDVLLTDDDIKGESFYNDALRDIANELERLGVAQMSDGALCFFLADDDAPATDAPLIIRKADGGFGYAATDLAALRYRVACLGASRVLYVVDSRQSLHFQLVFAAAERAGWIDGGRAVHVAFGSVLDPSGKPFKTREGKTVKLIDLLHSAVARATEIIATKNPGLSLDEVEGRARVVGIGAVKYADLSTNRRSDYVFDLERMLSMNGNTGVYLQYAYARVCSILRRTTTEPRIRDELARCVSGEYSVFDDAWNKSERELGLALDCMSSVLREVERHYEPHRLCHYLYAISTTFSRFYDACPVVSSRGEALSRRVALCKLTARTLELGLRLLGIRAPEEM